MRARYSVVPNKREQILKMFNGRCAYCGNILTPETFECDHIVPFLKGGKTRNNLFPACSTCNNAKSTKSIEEFRHYLENDVFSIPKAKVRKKFNLTEPRKIVFHFEEVGFDLDGMLNR